MTNDELTAEIEKIDVNLLAEIEALSSQRVDIIEKANAAKLDLFEQHSAELDQRTSKQLAAMERDANEKAAEASDMLKQSQADARARYVKAMDESGFDVDGNPKKEKRGKGK
jgi:hypothetical protein